VISNKADSSASEEWELQTYLEQIHLDLVQYKHLMSMRAHVAGLKVKDNSRD